ncbi:hypothetical protein DFH09DRAFT_1400255 [Mycena vulgaris]|nr:hypothetical protein DFH09DRAFT_1400255 [Mycena vulgaris]
MLRIVYTREEPIAAGIDPRNLMQPPNIEDVLPNGMQTGSARGALHPANELTPIAWYEEEIQEKSKDSKELLDARYVLYPGLAILSLDLQIAIIRDVLFTFRDKDFDGKWLRADPATADWKNHKGICGKPFNFDTVHKIAPPAAAAAAQVNPVVGPAIAGFSRSTALSYLLLSLAHRPADYLIMPGLETESLIDFIDTEAKSFFRAFRDKAFTAEDREATAVMAHAICWWACLERYGGPVTPDIMADQIQLEFSFDSVKVAVLDMEGRQIRDPHKRPPFLFNMDPTRWMAFCNKYRARQNEIKF